MDQIIKCLLLKNGDLLISQIMEVDTELGGPDCKMVKPYKMVKVDDDVLIEKQTQGKLDLQETIPIDENGNTLTVAEFFGQYNKQSEQALKYDKEFGYKVRPAMVRVFMKKGWGMTDEQFLAIQFGKDILTKTMIVYSLKKTLNNTISTLEKAGREFTAQKKEMPNKMSC